MKTKSYKIAVIPLLPSQAPNTHAAACLDPVLSIVDKGDVRAIAVRFLPIVHGTSRDDAVEKLMNGVGRYHDRMTLKHGDVEFASVDVEYDK